MRGGSDRRARGLSLVETVIAMGILLAGFMLFTRLFVYGVRGMDRGSDLAKAVSLAKSEIARLKNDGKNNRWGSILAEDGRAFRLSGYDVEIEAFEKPCLSPSTQWEQAYLSTSQARELTSAVIQVVVRVKGNGAECTLSNLISRPRLALRTSPIEIRNIPSGSIPGRGSVLLEAELFAADGSSIPATFSWQILPGSGNGTVVSERNGHEATLTNQVSTPFGTIEVAPGTCQVRARAVYFGEEILSDPYTVNLGS